MLSRVQNASEFRDCIVQSCRVALSASSSPSVCIHIPSSIHDTRHQSPCAICTCNILLQYCSEYALYNCSLSWLINDWFTSSQQHHILQLWLGLVWFFSFYSFFQRENSQLQRWNEGFATKYSGCRNISVSKIDFLNLPTGSSSLSLTFEFFNHYSHLLCLIRKPYRAFLHNLLMWFGSQAL